MKKFTALLAAAFIAFGVASLASCSISIGDPSGGYSIAYTYSGCGIDVTPSSAKAGDTVTITAEFGKITEIKVEKTKLDTSTSPATIEVIGDVSLTTVEDGKKYTFIMPECTVQITAYGTTRE